MPETKKPRVRPRQAVMVELNDNEMAKLKQLRNNRGERATYAGVVRELIMGAKK